MRQRFEEQITTIARFVGIVPVKRERKRLHPRGALCKDFWTRQFREVEELLQDWGYDVEQKTRVTERVELGEVKTIYINSATHPETKFYTLLHEVGHVLIRKDWKRFAKHYPNYTVDPNEPHDSRRERRKSYRIGMLAEEIEAWKRGRNFADRHQLYVDPLKYDADANAALMTYVSWIAEISQAQARAGKAAAASRKKAKRRTAQAKPRKTA